MRPHHEPSAPGPRPSAVMTRLFLGLVFSFALVPLIQAEDKASDSSPGPTPASAEATKKELLAVCEELREGHNLYFGNAQIPHIRGVLAEPDLPPDSEIKGRGLLGRELLRLGQNEDAIIELGRALSLAEAEGAPRNLRQSLLADLGLAYLRHGEVTNCIGFHNPSMCLYPIADAGRHPRPEAAREAMKVFLRFLEGGANPQVQWLMIIAAMTAGEYPEGVPPELRLAPPQGATSPGLKPFPNIAMAAGLDIQDNAGGALVEDFDGDGLLDIVTSSVEPCTPLRFFRNRERGGFVPWAEEAGLTGQLGGSNLLHADYDNDGDSDILVLRGGWFGNSGRIRSSLLRNGGDGTFIDVTRIAGLAEPAFPSQSAAWADYDLDGDLDLYVANEGVHPQKEIYPGQLFRNNGDGTFKDVALVAGVSNRRYAKGVAWGDYDNDGDPDLYISNMGPNRLYRNNGDGTFSDQAPSLGVTEPSRRSFSTWFFDYDNDGWMDIFVANYRATSEQVAHHLLGGRVEGAHPILYRNMGDGTFRDVSLETGWTAPSLPMGANFGDLDGDGWLDVYLGTGLPSYESLMPNLMYRNDGGRRFVDVTSEGGFGHLQKGHGVAFADLDNDGDQDIFEQMGGAYPGDSYPSALYQNPGHGNHWLGLRLHGKESNRAAIGTRLRLELDTGDGPRVIHRTVGTGGSFGASPLRQEIGLGKAKTITRLEVFWPASKTRQTFTDVALDRFHELWEGEKGLKALELPRLELAAPGRATHTHGID